MQRILYCLSLITTMQLNGKVIEKLSAHKDEIENIKRDIQLDEKLKYQNCKNYRSPKQCPELVKNTVKKPTYTDATINRIMSYPMTDVVKRCQKDYGYSDEDMVILEQELKRYFMLPSSAGMYSNDVDNLWHSFLLFTQKYAQFCHTYFDRFIHHEPEDDPQEQTAEQSWQAYDEFQTFVKNYEKIFKKEIHPIWFLDMCAKEKK